MKAIECRLPQEFDKSFIVFEEKGPYFPVPWHYHPEYELVLVTKSTGRRMVGDHIGYFNKGDLVFIGPYLPHFWVNDPEYLNGKANTSAEAIVIHFVDSFLGNDFMNIPEMEPFKKFLDKSKRGLVIKGDTKKEINQLMHDILKASGIQRLSYLLRIFDILSASSEYEPLASPVYKYDAQMSKRDPFSIITEYILRNFESDISLPEIAAVANMAVTTFCNFFKERYRVTFIEYLNTVRIGHACKLLKDSNRNIMEIAYSCGFNNLSNFNRQFKKFKKMTPREFRKRVNVEEMRLTG